MSKTLSNATDNDPILVAIAAWKRADRRADALYEALSRAEYGATEEFGPMPLTLIEWRRYSAIGGAEIERARDEFLQSSGRDRKKVLAEYQDAKARERAAKGELRAWYRRAGLEALQRKYNAARAIEQRMLMRLARSKPRTPAGAATLLAFVRRDMKVGHHPWQDIALGTIADTLKSWGNAA